MKEKNLKSLSVDEQKRINACENIVNWASEEKKNRGCIIIATNGNSSTCAVIGSSRNIITALTSALKDTPNLKSIIFTALTLDMITDNPKDDTDKD